MFKNVKILEIAIGDDIQIHHEKCFVISTNMPSICSEIPEIAFEISELIRKSEVFAWLKQWPRAKCWSSIVVKLW